MAYVQKFERILEWARERNLVAGEVTSDQQFDKLIEEAGEIAHGKAKGDSDLEKDGIGDVAVVLTVMLGIEELPLGDMLETINVPYRAPIRAENPLAILIHDLSQLGSYQKRSIGYFSNAVDALAYYASVRGYSFAECLDLAWDDIKDRKGRLIGGVFVKEADLPENQVPEGENTPTVDDKPATVEPKPAPASAAPKGKSAPKGKAAK